MRLILIAVVMLWMGMPAHAVTLVKDGKSDYVILLAAKPLPANKRAASELQSHLKQMSGAELAIVDDSKDPPPHSIIIGPNRFTEADRSLGNDGFVLKTSQEKVLIIGSGPRGTM